MRLALIIVEPPCFNLRVYIGGGYELLHVQTLVSQSSVKGFHEGVFHRFAWPNKIQLDAPLIRPIFQRSRLGFRAMIHRNGPRSLPTVKHPI